MGWGASTFCTPILTPTTPAPSSKHQIYIRHIAPLVVYTPKTTCHIRHQTSDFIHTLDAQSMPTDTSVPAMALSPGALSPPPHATQRASRVGDRNMNTHAQSMPVDMSVAALAPLPHVCSDQQDITSVGVNESSSDFVEAVAGLLQKCKVRVARHLQVRVKAHQMQLRARHAKGWDERHAEHGMSQTSVAQSVEQD